MTIDPDAQIKFGLPLSPAGFGAVGDGVHDDTQAILDTINAAVSFGYETPWPIEFPPGRFLVTETNVLGQWDSFDTSVNKGVFGLKISGASKYASQIVVRQTSDATDMYLYDGKVPGQANPTNNSLLYPKFREIGFSRTGAGTAKVHGFRAYAESNGWPSQAFEFDDVYFEGLGTVLQCQGDANASENVFVMAHGEGCETFLDVTNPQAVNHTFLGCNFEGALSDIFRFTDGHGLVVEGGSYIMSQSAAAPHYILSVIASVAGISGNFDIKCIRTEMRSEHARILNLKGADNVATYNLENSVFRVTTGGPRVGFNFASIGKFLATIDKCELLSNYTVNYEAGSWPGSFPKATAIFTRNGGLGEAEVAWADAPGGYVSITGDTRGAPDFSGNGT